MKKISLLAYSEGSIPKYYGLNPLRIKFYAIVLPLVSLICLVVIFFMVIYFKEIRQYVRQREPQIFQQLRQKNQGLSKQVTAMEKLNQGLTKKLATTTIPQIQGTMALSFFNIPRGFEDKTDRPMFSIQNLKLTKSSQERIKFSFDIHNEDKTNQKLAGYFFILLKSPSGYLVYPKPAGKGLFQLSYDQGEYFVTSRFRRSESSFPSAPGETDYLFKILIFSRTGDFVYKLIQPMELPL